MKIYILLLLLILSVQMGYAQSWSHDFMIKYKRVLSAVISPEGSKVTYEVSSPVMEGEKLEYNTQIWVADTDGSMNR